MMAIGIGVGGQVEGILGRLKTCIDEVMMDVLKLKASRVRTGTLYIQATLGLW